MAIQGTPTIVAKDSFDVEAAAKTIFKAVEGIGTDESSIISVVASCNNQQRQKIKAEYHRLYNKDIVKELKSEVLIRLSFDFKQLLQALFQTPVEFDANCLKASVKGLGTNEKSLVEILLTRTADELVKVREFYKKKFHVTLEEDIADDTSGDFRKFVYPLSKGKRSGDCYVNRSKAKKVAEEIDSTFTQFRGTDTPRYDFIGFCCCESYKQMKLTFDEYKELTNKSITDFIEEEFTGDTVSALKRAVKCAYSIPGFLAERLHKSLEGITIDNDTLMRIVVSRSEKDLQDIKKEFEARFHKTLESKVKSHTHRHFKQLLLAIIEGNAPHSSLSSGV